ncbi:Sensor histidine kinase RcsC [Rhodanobacter lindaniclasticus]
MLRPETRPTDNQLLSLITQPGFSTASQVTQLAGRGVGMDVVADEIKQTGGSLSIESEEGQGTTFVLRLPFTLAVTQAILVRIGEATFAIPMTSVQGVARVDPEDLTALLATEEPSFQYGNEDYGIHDLAELLGLLRRLATEDEQQPLLLTRAGDLRAAIRIDAVLGSREIVVKSVGPQISSVPGLLGATIMGDGSVLMILDLAPLVRHGMIRREQRLAEGLTAVEAPVVEEVQVRPMVMVVDDSITMRKVAGRVLERHGYEVGTAKDGVDALEKLHERVPDLMLLDIEMPRMDGYELATLMKADPRLRDVPIIIITSRSGDKHRQRAFDIGVDRYLGKPYQEAELLLQIAEVLEQRAAEPVHDYDTSAAVALLFDDSELGGQLRDALHERGARIVHEGGVAGLSRELLQQVGADVLVINLDDDADDALDQLYDMIDGDRPRVVFNDAQASRALAGWDRARWARHLAVKVLAMGDIDPPRPEDAREVQVTPAPIAPVPIAPAPVDYADGDAVDEPAAAIGVAPAGGEGDAASPAFEEVATLAAVEPPQDVPVDEPLPTLVADEEAFDLDLDLDGDINLDVESGILLDEDREAATDTGVIAESDDLAAELEALLASGELPDEEGDDTSGPGLRFTGDEEAATVARWRFRRRGAGRLRWRYRAGHGRGDIGRIRTASVGTGRAGPGHRPSGRRRAGRARGTAGAGAGQLGLAGRRNAAGSRRQAGFRGVRHRKTQRGGGTSWRRMSNRSPSIWNRR